ncbi:MAG TPA: PhnD/SsuA/transferrin family substrate-binding protein [Gaiellaceae bacterium]|nr:PhnD/SsuA/transferrin family substrate-binding protein [Gaiellaceae bacterium]
MISVGAVAYHPRIVTIWERFREYFADAGVPTDYVLYSNYERLVDALLDEEVDVAWNTNTAYVAAEERIGGDAQLLGMRDVDAEFRTVIAVRRGESFEELPALAGKRLALGSRDSGHAAILPLHWVREAGADPELVRFDTDLGKHGDTGDSEVRVVEAVARGDADAGALGDATWVALRAAGPPAVAELELAWRSPTYYHCNFTALPGFDGTAWSEALLAMSYDDPSLRPAMDLEGVKRWLPADTSGYATLTHAMREQGYLA